MAAVGDHNCRREGDSHTTGDVSVIVEGKITAAKRILKGVCHEIFDLQFFS